MLSVGFVSAGPISFCLLTVFLKTCPGGENITLNLFSSRFLYGAHNLILKYNIYSDMLINNTSTLI